MKNKHSKEELKHWCDNCCCCDCRQTKKEKLECKRNRKERPKPYSFEQYERDLMQRRVPKETIYVSVQSIDMADDSYAFFMELQKRHNEYCKNSPKVDTSDFIDPIDVAKQWEEKANLLKGDSEDV